MKIDRVLNSLREKTRTGFDVYQRRSGKYQLVVPICHEDGDMVDIYLQDSPEGENHIRICDFGMAVMRLSYTYELNTHSRQKIFDSILINSDVQNEEGNLYLDTTREMLYESVLQFAGCVQKVCNMRYWSREIVRSTFYEDLKEYTTTELGKCNPEPDFVPLPNYKILTVDWSLSYKNRNFYLFGVLGNDKAKSTAIALLEFKKENLPFISLVVYENMQDLGNKEITYLIMNADKQYPNLTNLREGVMSDIERYVA